MATKPSFQPSVSQAFPADEVERRLRRALDELGEDISAMREPWEPTFDSLSVVNIVLVVEPLLPGLRIDPAKVVRKGGYPDVNDAARDITNRLRRLWNRRR